MVDKQARLAGAQRALAGAKVLLEHADFRGCASRCYYAAYQAMWAALGEPEKKPQWAIQTAQEIIALAEQKDARDAT